MMTTLFFALGIVALIAGAEALVRGASKLALSFGISPLVVGLTIVAFGTSSPELAVSVQSAWNGQTDMAVANVVGSNILNVLLILGLSALITPLLVDRQLIRQEVPIMIGVTLLFTVLTLDGGISRGEGMLFVALLIVYTAFLIVQSRRQSREQQDDYAPGGDSEQSTWDAKLPAQLALMAGGLVLLVLGSNLMVDAAIVFARHVGISEAVIGLTVVAAGTSLPEIAASITAALRGQRDIAVGNVVGSNIFNILCALGVSAIFAPTELLLAPSMLSFDIPVMAVVAIACLPIFMTGNLIARWEGALFFAYYVAYTLYLVLAASEHDALGDYRFAMGTIALPLTAITLALITFRHLRRPRALP
ncbi:MAG: calcium/sodium antiporter [Gammaproteobacteria bacterium]|jgi:cation:H+ antiporter|nr:calcium/sodium antiporter [Gammaproteobacteria bacterium]MBU0773092.1 calcium/sodium antiporter [Gammaproteobacteria bacterium]MBU0855730.1 calcium/sodium antiporter [Gammaproteobacteria bacterium]MBU1847001.1 calcium/sodium antiporter [Gammaproteobacteria bacterium]